MTITTDRELQVLGREQATAIRSLQTLIGAGNTAKGFHDEGLELLHLDKVQREGIFVGREEQRGTLVPNAVRSYWTTRLSLVTTEVAEAIEELRNGRAVDETYWSGGVGYSTDGDIAEDENVDANGAPRKPEGVPSEVADVVIRAFDFADEAGFDLAEIIDRKLAYNATRGHKHGKKF